MYLVFMRGYVFDKCSALLCCIEYYDLFHICKGLKGNNKEE
jgi:hypothetical protein